MRKPPEDLNFSSYNEGNPSRAGFGSNGTSLNYSEIKDGGDVARRTVALSRVAKL